MLITRCSACSTEFRVSESQLAARNGWVRCGKCMAVFDARRALVQPTAEDASDQGRTGTLSDTEETASRTAGADVLHESMPNLDISAGSGIDLLASSALEPEPEALRPGSAGADTPYEPQSEFRLPDREMPDPVIDTAPHEETLAEPHVDVMAESPPEHGFVTESTDTTTDNAEHTDPVEPGTDHNASPDSGADEPVSPPELPGGEPPTAISGARESAADAAIRAPEPQDADLLDFGPKPHKRRTALWVGGSAVLLIALGAQAAFQYRSTIALLLPETKPYLEQFCTSIGCELPLPRRAELLSIETSDLQGHPNNPGVMVLAATLRNRAPFPQAYPALELTLTDDRDQPLARRVLQPADYLGPNASRPEGRVFAPSSEQPVRVFIEASALKATSYRLYLFHP